MTDTLWLRIHYWYLLVLIIKISFSYLDRFQIVGNLTKSGAFKAERRTGSGT